VVCVEYSAKVNTISASLYQLSCGVLKLFFGFGPNSLVLFRTVELIRTAGVPEEARRAYLVYFAKICAKSNPKYATKAARTFLSARH